MADWWIGQRFDIKPPKGSLGIAEFTVTTTVDDKPVTYSRFELQEFTDDYGTYRVVCTARFGFEQLLYRWRQAMWKQKRAPVPPQSLRKVPELCAKSDRDFLEKEGL